MSQRLAHRTNVNQASENQIQWQPVGVDGRGLRDSRFLQEASRNSKWTRLDLLSMVRYEIVGSLVPKFQRVGATGVTRSVDPEARHRDGSKVAMC